MENDLSGSSLLCLRCKTTALIPLASPDEISFYECPQCRRQFARKPGHALHFRWMQPISVALYPVIFEQNPEQGCEQVADTLAEQKSTEWIRLLIQEIRLELADPTQQVRDILDCRATEEDLRAYLRCLAEQLSEGA